MNWLAPMWIFEKCVLCWLQKTVAAAKMQEHTPALQHVCIWWRFGLLDWRENPRYFAYRFWFCLDEESVGNDIFEFARAHNKWLVQSCTSLLHLVANKIKSNQYFEKNRSQSIWRRSCRMADGEHWVKRGVRSMREHDSFCHRMLFGFNLCPVLGSKFNYAYDCFRTQTVCVQFLVCRTNAPRVFARIWDIENRSAHKWLNHLHFSAQNPRLIIHISCVSFAYSETETHTKNRE